MLMRREKFRESFAVVDGLRRTTWVVIEVRSGRSSLRLLDYVSTCEKNQYPT